jgi:hypothetical protein
MEAYDNGSKLNSFQRVEDVEALLENRRNIIMRFITPIGSEVMKCNNFHPCLYWPKVEAPICLKINNFSYLETIFSLTKNTWKK